jgi:hypothetical protein
MRRLGILFSLTLVYLAFGTAHDAQAQKRLCVQCVAYGEKCCGLQPTVAACVACSLGKRFDRGGSERWCRENQPKCSMR